MVSSPDVTLNIDLTDPQLAILDSRARFRIVVAGRRFGKTTLAKAEIFLEAVENAGHNVVYVAPTYSMAKRLMWKPLMRMIPGALIAEKSVSDLTVTLTNGSTITLFGSKNYDNIRGDGNDLVIFDEGADIPPEAWEEAARPSLSDRKGRALFIGTPKGRGNWIYDLFTNPLWKHFEYTTLDGGWVDAEEIAAAEAELDPRTFRQEYKASFEDYTGLVYYAFTEDNQTAIAFDPQADTWLTWDFNAGERPMAVVVVQKRRDNKGSPTTGYAVPKEFVYTNTNTEDMCLAIEQYLSEQRFAGRLAVTGDHAGNRRESSASRSDYLIIESHFKNRPGFEKKTRPVMQIQDRVNALNSMFTNRAEKALVVDKGCKQVIRGLQRVTWHATQQKLAETTIGEIDPTDALSYFAYNYFPVHRRESTTRHT